MFTYLPKYLLSICPTKIWFSWTSLAIQRLRLHTSNRGGVGCGFNPWLGIYNLTCSMVQSLGREDPLKEGMATHSSILT